MIDCCTNCPNNKTRETCTELCAEAETWADQDYFEENPKVVTYATERTLEKLQTLWSLDLAEMQTDVRLGIQEWHYVKNCGLTDQQMQAMWLYYWEKLTQAEIAVKLSISEPTVNKHLRYAKKKLIKMLKDR